MAIVALSALISCSVFSASEKPLASPEERPLAFPEAQGYGKFTQGGRGGRVIVVDSLEDSEKARPGTLRYAVKAQGPRIVVFAVSGVINLVKPLEIKEDFITIAGQTSPGGIVISGAETQIDASQVIIRYLRFRPGSTKEQGDAINAKRLNNIIIDHCSMSWANDEVASFYNNTDFTLQYSIISESLNNAGHAKGSHGYGGIWGGKRASFINNVLAHHISRNPRINGYRLKPNYEPAGELVDVRNNVIYNWAKNSAYGNEDGRVNFINNLYKPGPAGGDARFFLIENTQSMGQAYFSGNVMNGSPKLSANNALGIEIKNQKKMQNPVIEQLKSEFLVAEPFIDASTFVEHIKQSAEMSYHNLIINREVGANRNRHGKFQDSVDSRILNDIATGKATYGNGIIDSELQVIESWLAYQAEFNNEELEKQPADSVVQVWIDTLGHFIQ
ncbi:pectate lyase family protein [Paraglaciecola hydrolytica]|uniref:pectate lyase family protein n=1 Tax=Paraglaciecola hydrolytica TaxID=1799789 RepID=UPI0010421F1A|nr:pectate lyase C [Paraglaciecola hydrolytica]